LEEYYVGTLALPVCNVVTDGSILVISVSIFTGIMGNNFLATPWVDASILNISGV